MKYYFGLYTLTSVLYIFADNVCEQDGNYIVPEEYKLTIDPYFINFTFWGKVSIEFSIVNATSQIFLSAERIKHETIKLMSLDASDETSEINVGFMERDGSWLLFTIEELFGKYSLNISFTGHLSNVKEKDGFFYNFYIDNETEKMSCTRLYAASESRTGLFPSLDCPLSTTPLTAQIARDPRHVILSSLQLQDTSLQEDLLEDKVWDTLYHANISPNQVGFIIHELSSVASANFTVLAKSEALDQTNMSLSLLPVIAELLVGWFPDRPIPPLDIVALPDGSPEMIFYPGLVFCREDQILFEDKVSNSKSEQKVKESVVHILVRQLLLKLVTEEAGLLDGLATYVEQKLLSQLYPTRHQTEAPYMQVLQEDTTDFYQDSTYRSHEKFAGVLRMVIDDFSTEETVMKAISQLLNEREPVTSEQLFSIIDQLGGDFANFPSNYSYLAVLQAWMSQPGWPVVTVTLNESAISIAQTSSTEVNATWPIPLRVTSDKDFVSNVNYSHKLWLTESVCEIPLDSPCKWVLFSDYQGGLYRVNYDSSGWHMLADELLANHSAIPAGARSRLVDDVFHLAGSRLGSYDNVFQLTQYLANEKEFLPWQTAAVNFDKLIRLFYGTHLAHNIQEYVKSLYSPYFEEVYRITLLNESWNERLASSNALFWGCQWGLESCLQFTSELFKQWLSVSIRFPPDYKQAALCTGVKLSPEVFMEVFDAFTQSAVEGDRQVFLAALACTKSTNHIKFLLELVFLDESQIMIGHHSKLPLIQYLLEFPENIGIVISFLEKNYDTAAAVVGYKVMSSVWAVIKRNIHAQEDINLIQNMSENTALPVSLQEVLSSILETVNSTQRRASELAPLVTEGLSRHWAMSSSGVEPHPHFYVLSLLEITLLLLVCWLL